MNIVVEIEALDRHGIVRVNLDEVFGVADGHTEATREGKANTGGGRKKRDYH